MRIVYLPENMEGRDLVVGDLHGHLDDLQALLSMAEFNPERDRLFCTGDLVDRGPDSMGCLALMEQPWFYTVAGNHEGILIENVGELLEMGGAQVKKFRKYLETTLDNSSNGSGWIVKAFLEHPSAEYWGQITERVRQLPNLLVVGKGVTRFHVVHSDLFLGPVMLNDDDIDSLAQQIESGAINQKTLDAMATQISWSRALTDLISWGLYTGPFQEGLSMTFCGHNIVPEPILVLSHYHLDTGCFMKSRDNQFGLTMAVLDNGFPVKNITTKNTLKKEAA